ncbi:hypothetical protein TrVE_jg5362 [Triparma verrucosa]|uniref:Uncharacterized protein n=1 Tax=Triparma verrucosa TaxID=1606542 RepID=A0A9W7B7I9_9STRA|nr:hypothetical protein TrVE_jg5362 [Triparma verrucosa]
MPPSVNNLYHLATKINPKTPVEANPLLPFFVSITHRLNVADQTLPFYIHTVTFTPPTLFTTLTTSAILSLYHLPAPLPPSLLTFRHGPSVSLCSLGLTSGLTISLSPHSTLIQCTSSSYPIPLSSITLPLTTSHLRDMIGDTESKIDLTSSPSQIDFILDAFSLTIFTSSKHTHNSDYSSDQNLLSSCIRSLLSVSLDDRISVSSSIIFTSECPEWLSLFESRQVSEYFCRKLKDKYDDTVGGVSKIIFEVKRGGGDKFYRGMSVIAAVDALNINN